MAEAVGLPYLVMSGHRRYYRALADITRNVSIISHETLSSGVKPFWLDGPRSFFESGYELESVLEIVSVHPFRLEMSKSYLKDFV